jgi:hypothetical protein
VLILCWYVRARSGISVLEPCLVFSVWELDLVLVGSMEPGLVLIFWNQAWCWRRRVEGAEFQEADVSGRSC